MSPPEATNSYLRLISLVSISLTKQEVPVAATLLPPNIFPVCDPLSCISFCAHHLEGSDIRSMSPAAVTDPCVLFTCILSGFQPDRFKLNLPGQKPLSMQEKVARCMIQEKAPCNWPLSLHEPQVWQAHLNTILTKVSMQVQNLVAALIIMVSSAFSFIYTFKL
jgi:hypothetical protein